MGPRHNDHNAHRTDPRPGAAPSERGHDPRLDSPRGRGGAYDRGADMGGSGWSGASGRGGTTYEEAGYPDPSRNVARGAEGRYPPEGRYAHPSAYGRDARDSGYSREGGHGDPYGHHEPRGMPREGFYPREGADNAGGFERESGFAREDRFGHVPGQRWGGGYGGEVERGPGAFGRGFTGNDFGPPSRQMPERHFGNAVDRGGRGFGGFEATGWSGERQQGTDMGIGAPGDRGPHYGKGPKGYERSDPRIHEEICEAIAHQGYIDASDVEVKVERGTVTLTGTVRQREDKRGLERLTERQRGVDEVHNELRLRRPPGHEDPAAAPPAPSRRGDTPENKNGNATRS